MTEVAKPIILAITGASGAPYAQRLLQVLSQLPSELHVVLSDSGAAVIQQELGFRIDPARPEPHDLARLGVAADGRVVFHRNDNFMAPIASGSFLSGGMIVCPCSGSTMSAIAAGASNNLIQRAADVQLKEGRKLILVPRETPLSLIHLDNMRTAAAAGATILPAMPGWYHGVQTLDDIVDFIVARILDQVGIETDLIHRWGDPPAGETE